MRQISFHHLAERELNDATLFYEFESPGLGAAFLDAVEKSCASILEHPESGVTVFGGIRRRMIRRFPYALLYSIRSERIRILAVTNLKRRPMYWADRD
jgi:plasmid stabilization system protein ParE